MPRFRNHVLLLFMILVCAVTFFWVMIAESQAAVKVIFVKGSPRIMKVNTAEWSDCKFNMAIDNGDRIKTLKDEAVEIAFAEDNSNIVRIEEGSDVVVKSGQAPYSIELLNGATMAQIKDLPKNSTFEVRTPAGLCGARGTAWRSSTDGAKSAFDAYENSIYVKGIDAAGNETEGELIVEAGWKTAVDRFERPTKLERLSDADIARWGKWKEDLAGRIKGSAKARIDRASRMENSVEKLESKQSNVTEARDSERIREREERDRSSEQDEGDGHITPP